MVYADYLFAGNPSLFATSTPRPTLPLPTPTPMHVFRPPAEAEPAPPNALATFAPLLLAIAMAARALGVVYAVILRYPG